MAASKLTQEQAGDVAIIRFDDAPTRNALTVAMAIELRALLRSAEQQARAVLLTGGPTAFCSGASLVGDPAGLRPGEGDAGLVLEDHVNPLILTMRDLRIPLVTAVNGAAAGVGASFALMGDIIVAGEGAYFMQAFCRIGLVPDGGSPWLLTRTVGRVRAMELMLLGDRLPAPKAFEWGLVTRLVPDDEVHDAALELAARLAAGPTTALAMTRRAAWAAAETAFEVQLRLERELQRNAGFHADFIEGVTAFLEKRVARFRGR